MRRTLALACVIWTAAGAAHGAEAQAATPAQKDGLPVAASRPVSFEAPALGAASARPAAKPAAHLTGSLEKDAVEMTLGDRPAGGAQLPSLAVLAGFAMLGLIAVGRQKRGG